MRTDVAKKRFEIVDRVDLAEDKRPLLGSTDRTNEPLEP
jgi:hypothetical protein